MHSAVLLSQQGSLFARLASLSDSTAQLAACDRAGREIIKKIKLGQSLLSEVSEVCEKASAYLLLASEGVGLALRESFTRSLESFAGSKTTPRFRRGISSTNA